jgi:hypothetical protein
MVAKYLSDNKKFSLYITIKCKTPKTFRVWSEDANKKNSKYADRQIDVSGERTIYFSFPVSPKELYVAVFNVSDLRDDDFEVVLEQKPLKDYNIALDSETLNFLKLALYFSQVSGFSDATQNGVLYKTDDDLFRIKYFDVIRNHLNGKPMNTPARIGHKTGIIEVAKAKFDNYTIPMRLMILLHEFSHKYKNPKIGLEISNEIGADINALYIYLGLGFSKIDAICVFAKVFLGAQTESNLERMRKINDYIHKFENQEYAKLN